MCPATWNWLQLQDYTADSKTTTKTMVTTKHRAEEATLQVSELAANTELAVHLLH